MPTRKSTTKRSERSAGTGRFVSKGTEMRSPNRTVTETRRTGGRKKK